MSNNTFQNLESLLGPQRALSFIKNMLPELKQRHTHLQQAIEAGQLQEISKLNHQLAGTAHLYGSERLQSILLQEEKSTEDHQVILQELNNAIASIEEGLKSKGH